MKIVIGLGNPGRKYERTRHNAGFLAVDEIARDLRFSLSQEKYHAVIGKCRIGEEDALVVKPQTGPRTRSYEQGEHPLQLHGRAGVRP